MSRKGKPAIRVWLSGGAMTGEHHFKQLLNLTREAYLGHPDLASFTPFPEDIQRQAITPRPLPCGEVLRDETGLAAKTYAGLQDAIIAAGPFAVWRETYKHTDIGERFMNSFGCYAIVGDGGPYSSRAIRLWIVYMPPGLYYPWHHHPAEEMYMVVSGRAVFRRKGRADETLGEGGAVFHDSNQPHAMETQDDPVLCLVAWRNGFDTQPVLTPGD